jgi:hypothetical protein
LDWRPKENHHALAIAPNSSDFVPGSAKAALPDASVSGIVGRSSGAGQRFCRADQPGGRCHPFSSEETALANSSEDILGFVVSIESTEEYFNLG